MSTANGSPHSSPTVTASHRSWTYAATVAGAVVSNGSKTPRTIGALGDFLAVPHHSFAANRIWMHAVFLAGALSTWSRLLGADPVQLSAAQRTATDMRRSAHRSKSLAAKKARTAAQSWWWLWDPRIASGPGALHRYDGGTLCQAGAGKSRG